MPPAPPPQPHQKPRLPLPLPPHPLIPRPCAPTDRSSPAPASSTPERRRERAPESLLWLLDQIDSPDASVCLDVGHTAVAGGIPPADWVHALGHRLRHIHLSDNHAVHDDHLPLGDGAVDLPGALTAAASLPHAVSLGIECRLHPRPNLTKSLAFLSPFLPTP